MFINIFICVNKIKSYGHRTGSVIVYFNGIILTVLSVPIKLKTLMNFSCILQMWALLLTLCLALGVNAEAAPFL